MTRAFLYYLLSALIAAILLALPLTSAVSAETPPSPTVTVEAEGKVMAKPDLATLFLEVETQAAGAEAATADNARLADAMLKALKPKLGPEEKIQSSSFRITPLRSREKGRPPEIIGYQAVHRFQVQIRNLDHLGAVIDTASKNGASRVQGPYWGHSRQEELQREAAVEALGKARRMAEVLAQAAGLKIKSVQKISTGIRLIPPRAGAGEGYLAAKVEIPTPLEVGEEEIKSNVQAVFELAP